MARLRQVNYLADNEGIIGLAGCNEWLLRPGRSASGSQHREYLAIANLNEETLQLIACGTVAMTSNALVLILPREGNGIALSRLCWALAMVCPGVRKKHMHNYVRRTLNVEAACIAQAAHPPTLGHLGFKQL